MPNLTERCEHGWIDAADQCPDCKKLNALRARVAELEAALARSQDALIASHTDPQWVRKAEDAEARVAELEKSLPREPEGCKLIAHHTGEGWHLAVEDTDGEEVAMLEWPASWPEEVGPDFLRKCGFQVV